MKTVYLWILALGFIAASCSTSYRTTRVYDDVYTAHDYPVATQSPSYSNTPPPSRDGSNEPMRNRYEDEETYVDGDGNTYITKNYYGDNYSFYEDEYDYHYSSRINRFHRPYMGFSYWGGGYTDYYWYNPMFMGNSIYVGWGRPWWNRPYMWGGYYGPMYGMGWHNPWAMHHPWGWHNPYNMYGWGGYGGYNMGYMHGYNQGYMHGYYGNTGFWGSAMPGGGGGTDYGVSPSNYYYGSRHAAGGNVDNLASRRSSVDGPGKTNEVGTDRTGRYVSEVPRAEQSGGRLTQETLQSTPVSRGEAIRRDPVQANTTERITRTPETLNNTGTATDRSAIQRTTPTTTSERNVGTIDNRRDVVERQQQTDMINRETRSTPQRNVEDRTAQPQRQIQAPQQQPQRPVTAPQRTPGIERDYRSPQNTPQQRTPDYRQPNRNVEPTRPGNTPTRTVEPPRNSNTSPGRTIDRGSSSPGRNYSPQQNRSIQRSTPSNSSQRRAAPARSSSPSRSVGTPSGGSRSVGAPSGGNRSVGSSSGGGSRSVGTPSSGGRSTGGGRGPR